MSGAHDDIAEPVFVDITCGIHLPAETGMVLIAPGTS